MRFKYVESTKDSITQLGLSASGANVVPAGSLLVTTRATLGLAALARYPIATNQGFRSIVFGKDCFPGFYYHYAPLLTGEMMRRASGTTFLEISGHEFSAMSIPVPPMGEQWRIAEVLDAVDSEVYATERLVNKLESFKQGVVDDLLYDRTQWRQGKLSRFMASAPRNGYSPSEVDEWTGVQVLGLSCLSSQGFAPRQLKNAPTDALRIPGAMLQDGDLLLSRANTRDLVGLVGRYRDVGTPCLYPDLMMRLRPTRRVLPKFMEYTLRHAYVRRQIQAQAVGTSESMVKISSAIVRNLKVSIPEVEEQRRIVSIVEAHDARIAIERARLDKLRNLKAGLADDLLTGRVRVDQLDDLPV